MLWSVHCWLVINIYDIPPTIQRSIMSLSLHYPTSRTCIIKQFTIFFVDFAIR